MTNATWKAHPASSDFDTGSNWTGGTVPDGRATFGASSVHALIFSAGDTTIGGWILNAAAGAYTFLLDTSQQLYFTGGGVVIQHGSATVTDDGFMQFENSSSAGKTHFKVNGPDGALNFHDSSSAGSATIGDSGFVGFEDSGSAGSATINVTGPGELYFENSSRAGSATINNAGGALDFSNSSSAGNAVINNTDGAVLFVNSSTAGNARINNADTIEFSFSSSADGATIKNAGASVEFNGSSSADHATISNTLGGTISFFDTSKAGDATITDKSGGELLFTGSSSAGNATIDNVGGLVSFSDNSTADDAKLINKAGSGIGFSSAGPGNDYKVSAGSIQGAGSYYLSDDQLTLLSNRSTKVTGPIDDGGYHGSIVKEGTGTLTLAHASNAYSGGTLIDNGTLNVAALGAAGTGDITFETGDQTLRIQNAALSSHAFGNVIDYFDVGDRIDFAGLKFVAHAKVTLDGDTLSVKSGQITDTLTVFELGLGPIKVVNDGHGGTELVMKPLPPPEKPDGAVAAESDASDSFRLDAQHDVPHHDFILG